MGKGNQPVTPDFLVVRDAAGLPVNLAPGAQIGGFAAENIGRKLSLEFTARGAKNQSFDLVLEDAPKVFLTFIVDPVSGRIEEIRQKPYWPNSQPSKKIKKPGGGGSQPLMVPPANDACANAIAIAVGATAFNTTEATTDGPANSCTSNGQTHNDIWYSWLAPANGQLTISTCNSAAYDTALQIYAGLGCPPGASIACNDDAPGCAGFTSQTSAAVTGGQSYLLRVGGFAATSRGTGTLNVSFVGGGLPNDECAGAVDIDCGGSATADNTSATTAGSDPLYSCRFGGPGQGVGTLWYSFVASGSGATIDTEGSGSSDTLLGVYSGTCGALTEIGCDDDSGTGFLSLVNVGGLSAGTTYFIQVSSFSGSSLGSITVNVECATGAAPGDACEDAVTVACGGTATFDNSLFATDPGDPAFSCRFGGAGQGVGAGWMKFVATDTSARIDTNASLAFDTLLAVYDGTCGSFTELACSDDDGVGLLSSFCVDGLVVGNTYYIQAASYSIFDTGSITVTVECPCPAAPTNDECEDAQLLALPANVFVDNSLATSDIAVPCGVFSGPFQNVWYLVNGTGTTLSATTCNAGTIVSDTKISVFCADCLELVCVTGNDDDCPSGGPIFSSTVSWCSQSGASYLITVGNFSESTVPGQINLEVFDTGAGCVADVVCLPQGACCLEDGSCVTTTAGDCEEQGGVYNGDGTACTTEFVADGGFEAGPFSGNWTEFSTNFGTPICDPGSCGFGGGTGPHSGDFWSWFGGIPAFEAGSVEQTITIPVGSTAITFWLEIPVSSGNGVDFLRFSVDGNVEFSVLENDPTYAGTGYNQVSVPIGAYADGGSHLIRFESEITGEGGAFTNFFVDDVSLSATTFDCETCFTLDFTTEDDFTTPLGNGQKIDTEFGNLVTISSSGPNNGLAIFDSNPAGPNNPSQDLDLLVNRGNILILQNDASPAAVGGFFPRPNDDEDGGSIEFDLAAPAAPQSIVLIDIDGGTDGAVAVRLLDVNGHVRTYTIPPQWTGDLILNATSGWGTLDLTTLAPQPGFASVATAIEGAGFDGNAVVEIRVNFAGSGAVDDLVICD